jgi:glucosyl-3-phosphoglycerate synthase
MLPNRTMERPDRDFLGAVYELCGGQAKVPVQFHEIQDNLSLSESAAGECCDFWTQQGALEWSVRGHVALTHLGLAMARRVLTDLSAHTSPAPDSERLVSVVIPTLNEAKTIAGLVRLALADARVLEVIVVDDGSIDGTPDLASEAGATVMMSSLLGKGASMQDGAEAAHGQIVLFLDGDLTEVTENLVDLMTTPLLEEKADFVKARFSREAGRVTVLTARPLLSSFFPELGGFEQPLGGIVAARRSLLANIRFESDYGADVGLLIDAAMRGARLAEVDIGHIDHDSQPLDALATMAAQVTRVIFDRAWRHERFHINQIREMEELERRTHAGLLHAGQSHSAPQRYALIDMDGVLLDGRFVSELADQEGFSDELALLLDNRAIPEAERTRLIAALLTGTYAETIQEVAQSIPLMAGARETVVALRKAGYRVGIVTDSFHVVAETIRRRVFADFSIAHVLHFRNGRATGDITLSPAMVDPSGCRQHACCKVNVLKRLEEVAELDRQQLLVVGDGENDTCLLREAGISVAFRPRSPLVEEAADYVVRGSLTQILPLVGLATPHEDRNRPQPPDGRGGHVGGVRGVRVGMPGLVLEEAPAAG